MAAEDLDWERSKISNQDLNLMKKLGLMKKDDAIRFPSEESYPNPPMEYRVSFVDHLIRGLSAPIHDFLRGLLFVYGIQLHQLTPNSILHISIFITLCECFLGVPPNWALWKRIFLLRRNASRNATYNIGGVVICVRTDVEYFDVKFPDSVQGWRKKWLYIHEESANSVEHNIVPFDGNAKIQRRRSWDAEASEEEKKATEALMSRIRQLQNTRGEELSGVQITAYFLRIRVQPLQARKNPLWTYTGVNDANRLSSDLSAKDLEKLIRRISSLNKKDPVPSSCRVKPYSSTNPLPENHPTMSSLPPLPEDGEVEEQAVVAEDNQGSSLHESEVAGSHKSAASHEKEVESEASESTQSLPPAVSPKNKRKRDDAEASGTSKPEETDPSSQKAAYDPYLETLISSDEEEEPLIKDLLRIGTQFVGYREYASKAEEKLAEANERANTLAQQLEQSEQARKKAESDAVGARAEADKAKSDAAGVEDLRKRLHDAETSLSEHITAQSAREEAILKRLKTQSRRFVARTAQEFQLEEPVNDPLLDALSFLEVHGSEAREGIDQAKAGLSRLFPYFFPKKEEPATFLDLAKSFNSAEDLGLKMRQENMKVAVESTVALVADSRQTIDWMKLIFDNYSPIPDPPEVFPSSLAKKSSVPVNLDDSSSVDLTEELKELRVQLQSVKKQSLILMEQSRESSEKEKIALQQAQDAITDKDAAVAEADAAASRENSMLQLLTDASLDMAVAARRWVSDANTFWHARWDTSSTTTISPSTSEMAKDTIPSSSEVAEETPVTYGDLTGELKKKYDEIKSALEADLIGSFHRTRSHGIRWKGFSPEGALDGVDLSTPSEERTRSLRQEINFMVAHSLHRHSESLVNTLERVALRVIQEIMSHQYSPSGPALGTHQGEALLHSRPPLPFALAAPEAPNSSAFVVYKIGGDPSDYQFLQDAPKEIPHGYACAYVPDCSTWAPRTRLL
ncbi:hypothetical protein QYE76_064761 [Lolium multiflorum]|uniref:Transposase (putative) gypsy type domain-containing protein n=1 Tax=Lolium multiflorum TaxID=4521 RepID=A0AAD8S745_LOLMU|nr:hypothetical protein QYE76_064761 [Lolium multiflorum]